MNVSYLLIHIEDNVELADRLEATVHCFDKYLVKWRENGG